MSGGSFFFTNSTGWLTFGVVDVSSPGSEIMSLGGSDPMSSARFSSSLDDLRNFPYKIRAVQALRNTSTGLFFLASN